MAIEHFQNLEKAQNRSENLQRNLDLHGEQERVDIEKEYQDARADLIEVFESLDPVDQEELIEEYRDYLATIEDRRPTRFEVYLRVIQYVSAEKKKETAEMVQQYLADYNNDFNRSRFKTAEAMKEYIAVMQTIYNEGFAGYIALILRHGAGYVAGENAQRSFKEYSKLMFEDAEKIAEAFDSQNTLNDKREYIDQYSLPGVSVYLDDLRIKDQEAYEKLLHDLALSLKLLRELKQRIKSEAIDCNEQTVMHQDLSWHLGIPIHQYSSIPGHAALTILGYPIVLDTYDGKLRSLDEFIAKEGYEKSSSESAAGEGHYFTRREFFHIKDGKKTNGVHMRVRGKKQEFSQFLVDLGISNPRFASDKYWWQMVMSFDEDNEFAVAKLAEIFTVEQHHEADAIALYEKALSLNPNNTYGLRRLADLYEKVGDMTKAIELSEVLVNLDGVSETEISLCKDRLIDHYKKIGEYRKIVDIYKKLLGYPDQDAISKSLVLSEAEEFFKEASKFDLWRGTLHEMAMKDIGNVNLYRPFIARNYYDIKHYELAASEAANYLKNGGNYSNLGDVHYNAMLKIREYDQLEDALMNQMDRDNQDDRDIFWIASGLYELYKKDPKRNREDLHKELEQRYKDAPKLENALLLMQVLDFSFHNPDRTREVANEILKLEPGNKAAQDVLDFLNSRDAE